jgi:chemotaxis protein methyltransferase CheR
MQIAANKTIEPDISLEFRELLEFKYGIALEAKKSTLFETRLSVLMVLLRCTSELDLLAKLKNNSEQIIAEKVCDAFATIKTSWFRDKDIWGEIENKILPELADSVVNNGRKIRAWSCGCSTGQEPYSLAMIAAGNKTIMPTPEAKEQNIAILATDVSNAALKIARNAEYSRISLFREKIDKSRLHYFDKQGNIYKLKPEIKQLSVFARLNLVDDFSYLGPFHIVMCRNLLTNFTQNFWRSFLERMSKVMCPGGYLILGAQEWIFGDNEKFTMIEGHNCLYYRFNG